MEGQADRRTKECMEERIGIIEWTNGWTQEFRNKQADERTDKTILGFSVLENSVTASKHIFRDHQSQNTQESNFADKRN